MPQPSVNSVHLNAVLTNISVAFIQDASNFIANQVFPVVPVDKKSDVYYVYNQNDWFRDEAQLRADSTPSAGSGYNLSRTAYTCDVYAFHKDIGDQTRANADQPLNPDMEATQFVTQRLLLRQEQQWMADFFTPTLTGTRYTGGSAGATSVWGTTLAGINLSEGSITPATEFIQWSDYTNGLPIVNIETAKYQILSQTGFEPNVLVLGYNVWQKLRNHPTVIDRYKYTSAGAYVTEQILAELFEIDRVVVSRAVYSTTNEGNSTPAYAMSAGNNALLCYVAPNPGLLTPSAGYIFTWTGISEGLGTTIAVSKFRMQELLSDRVEGQIAFADQIVAPQMGYFFADAC